MREELIAASEKDSHKMLSKRAKFAKKLARGRGPGRGAGRRNDDRKSLGLVNVPHNEFTLSGLSGVPTGLAPPEMSWAWLNSFSPKDSRQVGIV